MIHAETEASWSATSGNRTRSHRLVFNVTSISRDEDIYLAELRLMTLVETDRSLYDGVNRRVAVYERRTTFGNSTDYHLIASTLIYGRSSGWETLTVTDAVKRWVTSRTTAQVTYILLHVSCSCSSAFAGARQMLI